MTHRYDHRTDAGRRDQGSRTAAARSTAGPVQHAAHRVGPRVDAIGVPRFLRESPGVDGPQGQGVTIQRDGDGPLPSSGFQLTPPSLLQPRDPYARYMPDFGFELQIDPELQAQIRVMMAARARELMNADHVVARVRPLLPAIPVPLLGGATAPGAATLPGPMPSVTNVPAGPAGVPIPYPAVGPETTRPGSGGDVLGAVLALPRVQAMLEGVKNDFTSGLSTYWDGASTFDRTAFVTGSVVVGSSMIAPILGFEEPRNFVLPLLNDVVVPIPGVPGYGLEMNFSPDAIMIGAHLDVGQFLPPLFDFGAASFEAIGGPPQPAPFLPISPMRDGSQTPSGSWPGIARGIAGRSGGGVPLDSATRSRFEAKTGQTLPEVRLHVDVPADRLASALGARAFTAGRDIFFRSGSYAPDRPEGRRLLAHELAHVPQQERGITGGRDMGSGIRVTEAGDVHEREADRIATRISSG